MISQITEQLFVGDLQDVQLESLDEFGIDHVVGVCQDSAEDNVSCEYSYFPLSDGEPKGHCPGRFEYTLFERAADTARSAVVDGERVLVHCHMGRSRSVSIVAAVIAVEEGIPLWEAYGWVRDERYIQPSREIREFAMRYVEDRNQ